MRVGGYSLDLYCDLVEVKSGQVTDALGHRYNEFPHEFYGQTGPECDRDARKRGWLISQKRTLCPKCNPRSAPNGEPT